MSERLPSPRSSAAEDSFPQTTSTRTSDRRTTVIGLGSMLMADDGLGLAALTRLEAEYELPDEIILVDGGTWGMNLLPTIEDADRLLLVDAINAGVAPGEYVRLGRHEIPRYLSLKVSPHQVDLSEVLALAELRGTLPAETVAIGLQPELVEMRTELSPCIETALGTLVERLAGQLRAWGHELRERHASRPGDGAPADLQLDRLRRQLAGA